MARSDVYIRIGAKLDDLQRGIRKSQAQLGRFANFAESTGSTLTARLSAPLALVGAAAVKTFASFEKTKLGLTALYQSADVAEGVFQDLLNVVKDTRTTLDFSNATKIALQFKAVGIEGAKATNVIKQLGIAATLSGSSAEDVGEVGRQLAQSASKGKILQQELRIILERMPALAAVINEEFGTVTAEGLNKAGVSAAEFIDRMTKGIETNEQFQSVQGGLSKAIESFGIELQIAGSELGQTIAKTLNLQAVLSKLSEFVSKAVNGFKSLSPTMQKIIVYTSAAAVALGPLLIGIGAITKAIIAFRASLLLVGGALKIVLANPITIAIAALVGLVYAFKNAYEKSDKFRASIQGIAAVIKNFVTNAINRVKSLADVFKYLYEGNIEAAGAAARTFTGIGEQNGKTAGEAFIDAYSDSIQKSAAGNFGNRGRIGGSVARITDTPDITPSQTPVSSLGDIAKINDVAKEIEINYFRASKAVDKLSNDSILNLSSRFREASSNIQSTTNFLVAYDAEIDKIDDKQQVFGDSFDGLSEKIRLTESAINSALENGFSPTSDVIQELSAQLENLNNQFNPVLESLDNIAAAREGIVSLTDAIVGFAEKGAVSFKSFALAAVDALSKVVGALIQQAVAQLIANSVKFAAFLGPAAIPVAVGAGKLGAALFSSVIKNVAQLAEGGIIPPGYNNDTFPALLSSGEAVIPLDKLSDMISDSRGGTSVIRGRDIYLAYNRESASQKRIL